MQIVELETGTKLTFLVTAKGKQISFESSVVDVNPNRHYILAEAVMSGDRIVSFKGEGITASMLAIFPGDKPMMFIEPEIITMRRNDNTLCYKISSPAHGKPFNRRGAYRCVIGVDSTIQYELSGQPSEVFIKDVSVTGFAIVCSSTVNIAVGQLIHVVLTDSIEEPNGGTEQFSFNMYGIVVRNQLLDNGKIVYGCRFNDKIRGLDSYLAKKDRIAIAKNKGE
ncbi:MAG: PilZ domain-containing protein [Acetatifactor sp.]|nr:PilZ domain-containing protein [Acetatifactor sp.]